MPDSTLKDTLARLLEERELSVLGLSKRSGVKRSTLVGWLNGSHPRSLNELLKAARALSVSFEYLCFGKESDDLGSVLNQAAKKIVLDGYYRIKLERLDPPKKEVKG